MSHEATIASCGGDEATLIKSLIIFLEDATANRYSRRLHLLLAIVKREVSAQLSRVL
jgi:hypothetical protein